MTRDHTPLPSVVLPLIRGYLDELGIAERDRVAWLQRALSLGSPVTAKRRLRQDIQWTLDDLERVGAYGLDGGKTRDPAGNPVGVRTLAQLLEFVVLRDGELGLYAGEDWAAPCQFWRAPPEAVSDAPYHAVPSPHGFVVRLRPPDGPSHIPVRRILLDSPLRLPAISELPYD